MRGMDKALKYFRYKDILTDYRILDSYIRSFKRYEEALRELEELNLVVYENNEVKIYYHGIIGKLEDVLGRPILLNKISIDVTEFPIELNIIEDIKENEILSIKDIEQIMNKFEIK